MKMIMVMIYQYTPDNENQEASGSTSPLNDSVLSDVSYGVDVCNRFACLLVEPIPDDCADPTIRSDSPDSSCMNSSCLTPQLSPDISLFQFKLGSQFPWLSPCCFGGFQG